MTTYSEDFHAGGFIVSEANGSLSREQVTIKESAALLAGQVLGLIDVSTGAPVYAATAGNTGNFTCGTIAESAGALPGAYKIEFLAATVFNVIDPAGALVAEGHTGVAFAGGGLSFTITAGGTAAVAGDSATITVSANADAGKYVMHDPAGMDGRQNAAGVLYAEADASAADISATIIARNAEVNGAELVWIDAISGDNKTAGIAALKTHGIIVR